MVNCPWLLVGKEKAEEITNLYESHRLTRRMFVRMANGVEKRERPCVGARPDRGQERWHPRPGRNRTGFLSVSAWTRRAPCSGSGTVARKHSQACRCPHAGPKRR